MPYLPRLAIAAALLLTVGFLPVATPAASADPVDELTAEQKRLRRRTPVVEVFERARGSVVNISSTRIVQVRNPFGVDDLFDELFDLPGRRRRQYRSTSVGSGFVLHHDGYVVTNAHVVARTAERRVIFADKRAWPAEIVAIDLQHDLAILKFDPAAEPEIAEDEDNDEDAGRDAGPRTSLRGDEADEANAAAQIRPLPLGTSSDLMVGETVIAIGNPFGFQHTVTSGVVSAVDRRLRAGDVTFEGLIQTDASINPGNSGGPLLNVLGELVGVNTAIRADAENIGFAIPVDRLRELLPELLDIERRYRINIGLRLSPSSASRVDAVVKGSPADKAGLRVGDVLRGVNGKPLRSSIDFYVDLLGRKAGDRLVFDVQRGSERRTATLTITARKPPDGKKLLADRFGIDAEQLTGKMARALRLDGLRGLVVESVEYDSPADRIGLRRGDIIAQIGRHPAADFDDVGDLLEQVDRGDTVALTVLRVSRTSIYRVTTRLKAR